MPGFDIDEDGLQQREGTWSDGTPPESPMPQGVTPGQLHDREREHGLYVTGRSIVQRRESLPRFP